MSRAFPSAISSRKLLSGDIAKEVCARISDELVSIIPQVNDYLCPICYAIAYQPVRLDCQHVFCIRCSVKLQRRQEEYCPLCRARVVMDASASKFVLQPTVCLCLLTPHAENIDSELEKFLRKNFPAEVKEKERADQIERGIEEFGPSYKPAECAVM